ncbi:MAG: cytochrome-c peroxidase [bacterium]
MKTKEIMGRAIAALSVMKSLLPGVVLLLLAVALSAMSGKSSDKDNVEVPGLAALPAPPIPADNPQTPEKVELGKLLFFDARLGGDVSIACSDCHNPTLGWQDAADICRGYPGTSHWRNCQTIINAAYLDKLFWAGAARSLEGQARSAARGGVAGNGEDDMMEERLRQIPEYIKRFREVFGTVRPEIRDVWRAISAFERTLVQRDTPFDQYMQGDKSALSEDAIKGMELFKGKAGCLQCHNGPLLTDQKYYNLGVPENPVFEEDALKQITFRFEQYAKGVSEEIYHKTKTDLGLYYRSKRNQDMGKFRTPSLRYLVYTPPYMHNGTMWSLEEVIDFYNKGGGEDQIEKTLGHRTKTDLVKPLGLTDEEKAQLVAFLESLSGEEIIIDIPELPPYGVDRGDGLRVEEAQ